METIAVISGAEAFCKNFKTTKCGNIVIGDTRYVRISDESKCCGYQFDDFQILGRPELNDINVSDCVDAVKLRIR